jgi:hypothetical protein
MPTLYGVAKTQNVNVTNDGNDIAQRMTRDGAVIDQEWLQSMVTNGRAFATSIGSLATPIASANAAVTSLRPMGVIRVPSATTIIPVRVKVDFAVIAGTANDAIVAYCQNDVGNGTSVANPIGPISMRTDAPIASTVTIRNLYTGDCTAPTNPVEIARKRFLYATTADAAGVGSSALAFPDSVSPIYPLLIGPASLLVYVGGTTTGPTFYGEVEWVEVPSSWFV